MILKFCYKKRSFKVAHTCLQNKKKGIRVGWCACGAISKDVFSKSQKSDQILYVFNI